MHPIVELAEIHRHLDIPVATILIINNIAGRSEKITWSPISSSNVPNGIPRKYTDLTKFVNETAV